LNGRKQACEEISSHQGSHSQEHGSDSRAREGTWAGTDNRGTSTHESQPQQGIGRGVEKDEALKIFLPCKELYALFLESRWWLDLSRECRKEAGGRCSECGSTNRLQAHHLRYPDNWFDTTLKDLRCLCDDCHAKAHGLVETAPTVIFKKPAVPQRNRVKRKKSVRHRKKRRPVPFQKWRTSSGRRSVWKQFGNSSN
jgi:hypothetical protein